MSTESTGSANSRPNAGGEEREAEERHPVERHPRRPRLEYGDDELRAVSVDAMPLKIIPRQ